MMMTNTTYTEHPALKPTVLLRDLMKNVYRPSGSSVEMSAARPDATSQRIARETNRAA